MIQATRITALSPRFGTQITLQNQGRRKNITETLEAQPHLFDKFVRTYGQALGPHRIAIQSSDPHTKTIQTSVAHTDTEGKKQELRVFYEVALGLYNHNQDKPEAETSLYWSLAGLAHDLKEKLTSH